MDNMKDYSTIFDSVAGDPTSVQLEVVEVGMSTSLVSDYAKAFIHEANRKAPLIANRDDALTVDELIDYSGYLLTQRIKSVQLNCPDWRKLKILWIPSFIQYVLSRIGEVVDRQFGLKFVPVDVKPSTMSFDEARAISEKIAMYKDYLQMVKDAMPRGVDGDPDVMSCAVIEEYVRSTKRVSHPTQTYVAAFVHAQLIKETAFKSLYRIQYDDVEFIKSALLTAGGDLIC